MRIVLLLCALAFAGAASPAAGQKTLLRLSANHWEPYTGAALPNQGVATEIVVTALERAGYATEVSFVPWSRALSSTYSGSADGIVAIWPTSQRRSRILFSDSYLSNSLYLLYLRPELAAKSSMEALDGVRIGVGRDYDYSDSFLTRNKYSLEPVDRVTQNLSKLYLGRVDMVLEDKHIVEYTLRNNQAEYGRQPPLKFSDDPLLRLPLHFGINRNHPDAEEIIAAFNAQLKSMKKDGTLASILRKLDPKPQP